MGSETDRDGHSRHPPNQTADCPWAPRTLHPIQTKKEGGYSHVAAVGSEKHTKARTTGLHNGVQNDAGGHSVLHSVGPVHTHVWLPPRPTIFFDFG